MAQQISDELAREIIAYQNRSTSVHIPDKVKVFVGIGAAIVAAAAAYDASVDGLERFEDKAGKVVDKVRSIKTRHNAQPDQAE